MEATKVKKYSIAEYLEMEENSVEKHEYYGGEIFAMSGGSHNHSLICNNIGASMRNALLKKGKCIVLNSDMRIALDHAKSFVYPDSSVYCGKPKFSQYDKHALSNPVLIVEVMSKSTKSYDRGDKFWKYRQIPSFREYVLIEQDEPVVEVYSHKPDGSWTLVTYIGLDKAITLHSINATIAMLDIYYGALDLQQPNLRLFKED